MNLMERSATGPFPGRGGPLTPKPFFPVLPHPSTPLEEVTRANLSRDCRPGRGMGEVRLWGASRRASADGIMAAHPRSRLPESIHLLIEENRRCTRTEAVSCATAFNVSQR